MSDKLTKDELFNIDFVRKRHLDDEVAYLLRMGYIMFPAIGIKGGRQEKYLLFPRFNESPIHFFYCKIIEEFLLWEYLAKVKLFITKRPDIVFSAGGRKFAVEVETGSGAEHPDRLRAKVERLNEEFGERWFFVVTSYKLREKYEKYGRTLVRGEVAGELRAIFGQNSKEPSDSLRG